MPAPNVSLPSRFLAITRRSAIAAVAQVATIVARSQHRLAPDEIRRKGVGDFVTAADVCAERRLRRLLTAAMPDAGFLGEETASLGLDRDFVWVVDPIDGTSNFANGLPHYAVAVALLHLRRPVVAALWCSPEGALYDAVANRGARRNGRRITMPAGRWGASSILGCQWHRGQQDMSFLARLQRHGGRVRTFGSTVVQLADVASGRLDANVQQQGRIWDLAAPGLLVQEAGGRITDWSGRPLFPFASLDLGHLATVAAGPRVHRRILTWLAQK